MQYTYIDTNDKLSEALKQLSQATSIAVDFEGDYNRFKYGLTLCLVQIYDGKHSYIIDPFTIDMQLLKDLFTGKQKKIMFDPSGDLILLKNTCNMTMQNVIDVQLAAKLLNFPKLSLTSVLNECLGVEIINKKKFQTANWTKRPLSEELQDYAISDVIYLLKLLHILMDQIKEEGKYGLFLKMNRILAYKDYNIDQSKRYLKLKNAKRLNRTNKIYLKHFFDCRDRIAQARDVPPYYIMPNDTLLKISQVPPKSKHDWLTLNGIPKYFHKYISEFNGAKAQAERVINKLENKS